MFLHLGNDIYVNQNDIIAVCNLDTASVSKNTQLYLKRAEEMGIVETICSDIPKSFVIVRKKNNNPVRQKNGIVRTRSTGALLPQFSNKDKVYLTNISSATLIKRAENDTIVNFESEE